MSNVGEPFTLRVDGMAILAEVKSDGRIMLSHVLTADAALLPPKDISNWLEGIREDCTRYSNAVKNNADQLASLEEETKGYARVDIAELDGRIRQTTAERKAADAERGMRKGFVNAHETALRSINETEKRLKRTEDAMKRLDELSVLANGGRGGDNDRVDFVRYMLGDSLLVAPVFSEDES